MENSLTAREMTNRLIVNLRAMAPEGGEYAYITGYLAAALPAIAERGVSELAEAVEWTNRQVEAKNKGVA
jgi:hypothetical protein